MSNEEAWVRIFEALADLYMNNEIRIERTNTAYEAYRKKLGK